MNAATLRKTVLVPITILVVLVSMLPAVPAALAAEAIPPSPGLVLLQSETARYTVWRPGDWQMNAFVYDDSSSTMVMPGARYPGAYFAIVVTETGLDTSVDRLQRRSEAFDSLAHALPNTQIEWQSRTYVGNMLVFDAQLTSRDDTSDVEAKRWVRQIYVGTRQYWLVAAASSPEEFAILEPDFLAMMVTFQPADAIYPVTVAEGT
jgi:hypothetical protein